MTPRRPEDYPRHPHCTISHPPPPPLFPSDQTAYPDYSAPPTIAGQPPSPCDPAVVRCMPTPPASTPPPHHPSHQYAPHPPYDPSRHMYSAPSPAYPPYATLNPLPRYAGPPSSPAGVKHEMGPPTRAGADPDAKPDAYPPAHDPTPDPDFPPAAAPYAPATDRSWHHGLPHVDHHASPDMSHAHSSPSHLPPSGRATPRAYASYPPASAPQQRPASSNLAYVMTTDARAGAGAAASAAPPSDPAYAYACVNGTANPNAAAPSPALAPSSHPSPATVSHKRCREDDANDSSYAPADGLKRSRTDPGLGHVGLQGQGHAAQGHAPAAPAVPRAMAAAVGVGGRR